MGRLSRYTAAKGLAGQESHRPPPLFHMCLLLWEVWPERGKLWGAGQRGVPTRSLEPRLEEGTVPTVLFPGEWQPLESLNSQLATGLLMATGAGSEGLKRLLKSQHTLNTATPNMCPIQQHL